MLIRSKKVEVDDTRIADSRGTKDEIEHIACNKIIFTYYNGWDANKLLSYNHTAFTIM